MSSLALASIAVVPTYSARCRPLSHQIRYTSDFEEGEEGQRGPTRGSSAVASSSWRVGCMCPTRSRSAVAALTLACPRPKVTSPPSVGHAPPFLLRRNEAATAFDLRSPAALAPHTATPAGGVPASRGPAHSTTMRQTMGPPGLDRASRCRERNRHRSAPYRCSTARVSVVL